MVHRYDFKCFKKSKFCEKGLTQLMPFLKIIKNAKSPENTPVANVVRKITSPEFVQ